ncbi:Uncharacterised protein [Burkholderia pseudomallei]|nr:Uncharacterised protein [Burkholderia pseudomallei]
MVDEQRLVEAAEPRVRAPRDHAARRDQERAALRRALAFHPHAAHRHPARHQLRQEALLVRVVDPRARDERARVRARSRTQLRARVAHPREVRGRHRRVLVEQRDRLHALREQRRQPRVVRARHPAAVAVVPPHDARFAVRPRRQRAHPLARRRVLVRRVVDHRERVAVARERLQARQLLVGRVIQNHQRAQGRHRSSFGGSRSGMPASPPRRRTASSGLRCFSVRLRLRLRLRSDIAHDRSRRPLFIRSAAGAPHRHVARQCPIVAAAPRFGRVSHISPASSTHVTLAM